MPPPSAMPEMMVREYRSTKEYQKSAERLAKQGWTVQSVTERQPRAGCARILFLGLFAGIFRPKSILVVTFVRSRVA
jgi:hypothetical protein